MKNSILAIVLLGSSGVLSNQVLADGFDPWVGASNATHKASATPGPVLGMDGFRPWDFDGANESQINGALDQYVRYLINADS